mgnify:CR=1 FL=1
MSTDISKMPAGDQNGNNTQSKLTKSYLLLEDNVRRLLVQADTKAFKLVLHAGTHGLVTSKTKKERCKPNFDKGNISSLAQLAQAVHKNMSGWKPPIPQNSTFKKRQSLIGNGAPNLNDSLVRERLSSVQHDEDQVARPRHTNHLPTTALRMDGRLSG